MLRIVCFFTGIPHPDDLKKKKEEKDSSDDSSDAENGDKNG